MKLTMKSITSLVRKIPRGGGGGAALTALLTTFSASAETYYLGAGSNGAQPPNCFKFYSDEDLTQEVASVTPSASDGNTYVVLASGKMNPYTAPAGTKWIFGRDGDKVGTTASSASFYTNAGTFDFGDVTVYGIKMMANVNGMVSWRGTNTLVKTSLADNITFGVENTANDAVRGVDLAGTFIADEDVTVGLLGNASYSYGAGATPLIRLSGDFTNYKGKFTAATSKRSFSYVATVELTSPSAFGDPSVEAADYLTLAGASGAQPVRWSIDPSVVQYATKGIVLALTTSAPTNEIYAAEDSSWTLTAPVAVKTEGVGVMAKVGAGTVTLNGPVSVPNLDVREGTLVIGKSATFGQATTLTIRSGATVISQQGLVIDNVTVTKEDGATLSLDFTVTYADDATTALDCSTLTDAEWNALTKPIPLKLSEPIAHPHVTALRLPMLKLPHALGATASDFSDTTGKTYDLPVTTFEVAAGEDDCDIVYMNVRPVLYLSVAQNVIGHNPNLLDANQIADSDKKEYPTWTDGLAAHEGADYVVANGAWVRTTAGWWAKEWKFPGESLTLASGAFMTKAMSNVFNRVVFCGGTTISLSSFQSGENVHVFDGECRIASGTVSVNLNTADGGTNKRVVDFAGTLTGAGTLNFTGSPSGLNPRITGDGSAFAGKIVNNATGTESAPVLLECADLSTLLAERTTADNSALTASGPFTGFHVTADGTFADEGFGLMLSGEGSAISVAEGKTLTVAGNVTLANATTSKRGGGTLALGGTTLYGTSSAAQPGDSDAYCVELRGGWVKPVAWNEGASYYRTRFKVVSADSGFAFDAASTDEHIAKYGLCLAYDDAITFDTDIETLPIKVDLPETLPLVNGLRKVTSSFSVPVLTVSDALVTTLAGKLKVVKNYRGAKATITSAAATDREGFTTFTVKFEPSGAVFIIR